ncbi:MAG TPA: D-2-hydroxyacid dehydrogenase [Geobacteraceae bacterium]
MENIVFLDRSAIRAELRKPCFDHHWQEYPVTAQEQVVQRLKNATIAITDRVSLGEAQLAQLPKLRLIAVAATGVDGIDLEACSRLGIAVANVRNWSISVPEHVFALILALRRNLPGYHELVRSGAWQKAQSYSLIQDPIPLALRGETLGIIGYGALGQAVARLAEAFGMEILVAEHKDAGSLRESRTAFSRVLEASDVIVLLCPLTEKTRGLMGTAELSKMRRHALLINCARGEVVDEVALSKALQEGTIAGAGLDVLSQEPPVDGNPLLCLHHSNLIITPHVAWVSERSMQELAEQLIGNLEAFASGTPRNLVRLSKELHP